MDGHSFGSKEIETNLFNAVFRQTHKGGHNRVRMTGKFDHNGQFTNLLKVHWKVLKRKMATFPSSFCHFSTGKPST